MIKEALEFITELKEGSMEPKVVNIAGKTYCNRKLTRYDKKPMAEKIRVSTLTALVDYIKGCPEELGKKMLIQVKSPSELTLASGLNDEREREELIYVEADLPHFKSNRWVDQETFILELQSKFVHTPDLKSIMTVAGNIEAKTTANYGDDGVTQKTTIQQGVASKTDVIVPNPVELKPYRTFLEIDQPTSNFVFRIDGSSSEPRFTLIEADGGIWINEAKAEIKEYLEKELADINISSDIVIIA